MLYICKRGPCSMASSPGSCTKNTGRKAGISDVSWRARKRLPRRGLTMEPWRLGAGSSLKTRKIVITPMFRSRYVRLIVSKNYPKIHDRILIIDQCTGVDLGDLSAGTSIIWDHLETTEHTTNGKQVPYVRHPLTSMTSTATD